MDNWEFLISMGRKIKAARKAKKLSLERLAQLCNTDMSNLWFLEQGQRNTHILTLKTIADVLERDIKEFL